MADIIKLVNFDMDGTIFDTERLGFLCWKEAFQQMKISVPEKVLLNKIGLNSKDSEALIKKESGVDFDYNAVKKLKRDLAKEHIEKTEHQLKMVFLN